jgi:ubiquitin-protein ligase
MFSSPSIESTSNTYNQDLKVMAERPDDLCTHQPLTVAYLTLSAISIVPSERNLYKCRALMAGPTETPYHFGFFEVRLPLDKPLG